MSLDPKKHHPVMLNQVLSIISPQHGGTYIDCTFGGGGYSQEILKFSNTKVIALDRDKLSEIWNAQFMKDFQKMHIEKRAYENDTCKKCLKNSNA